MLSIVIPARNEALALGPLIAEIERALVDFTGFEIIVVDDGSTDATEAAVLASPSLRVRYIRHPLPGGQSAAIHSGVRAARHSLICTLDGDGQNPPDALPQIIAPLLADQAGVVGLVAGQRVGRHDTVNRRLASGLANWLRRLLLRDGTRDTGCGLKVFRREAFLDLPYFNHMHRYLPALFLRDRWQVLHVDVPHRPRLSGRTHYSNLQRALVGAVDLCGVLWLIRRRKKVRPAPAAGLRDGSGHG